MRTLAVTVGPKEDHAHGKTVRCTWPQFVQSMLARVPETSDKAEPGWVCGAEFENGHRHHKHFIARHLLSFDYDHITPEDLLRIRDTYRGHAGLLHPTWSSTPENPRYRLWLPLSRPVGDDEFEAISRKVAARAGIELAARESHTPPQYMFRPAVPPFAGFEATVTDGPWLDADAILGEYDDWTNRAQWPHRAEGDGVHNVGQTESPLDKSGVVGAFCRAFPVSVAIERFGLPYGVGSSEHRRTFTRGSRPDGCVIYDNDTKFHSHHDTDPARGQHNAYDLVRLHHFGDRDKGSGESVPLHRMPSSVAMGDLCRTLPELAEHFAASGFSSLADDEWTPAGSKAGRNVGGLGVAAREAAAGVHGGPDASGGDGSRSAEAERAGEPAGLPARINSASSLLTDQENARRIQARHRTKLITVGGEFYIWTGTHWQRKDTEGFRAVTQLSQLVSQEGASLEEQWTKAAGDDGIDEDQESILTHYRTFAASCGDVTRLAACEKILRKLLEFEAARLNSHADLFACANGVLDLRSGKMEPHNPEYFITACAPTKYNPDAAAPRFERFLAEIFDGCEEKIPFVQRWLGYCLTGHTSEQKLMFHTGAGGNGKSVLIKTVEKTIGSGYCQTQMHGLLTMELKGATPELAELLGQRMVTIKETPDGLSIKEGLVKTLTGGDAIRGRQLYAQNIEFPPTHKLQIFTNYMPVIQGQDQAIWRRILKLHYPWRYGDSEAVASGRAHRLQDLWLDVELAKETEGVLRWLVEGSQAWYAKGLCPPPSVVEDTSAYRSSQDLIGLFLKERTVRDPAGRVALYGVPESLYIAYQGWMRQAGHHAMGRPRFMQTLEQEVPYAKTVQWQHGRQTVHGLQGLRLTDQGISD